MSHNHQRCYNDRHKSYLTKIRKVRVHTVSKSNAIHIHNNNGNSNREVRRFSAAHAFETAKLPSHGVVNGYCDNLMQLMSSKNAFRRPTGSTRRLRGSPHRHCSPVHDYQLIERQPWLCLRGCLSPHHWMKPFVMLCNTSKNHLGICWTMLR